MAEDLNLLLDAQNEEEEEIRRQKSETEFWDKRREAEAAEYKRQEEEDKKRQEEQKRQQDELSKQQEELRRQQEEIQKDILPPEDQYQFDPFENLAHKNTVKLNIDEARKNYDPFIDMAQQIKPTRSSVVPDLDWMIDKTRRIREVYEKRGEKFTTVQEAFDAEKRENEKLLKETSALGVPEEVAKTAGFLGSTDIGSAIQEGLMRSASGVTAKTIFGIADMLPDKDKNWLEKAAAIGAEIIGDTPFYTLGAGVGSGTGAAIGGGLGAMGGSVIPGAGTVAGAIAGGKLGASVGAGAGALALPELMKQVYSEYQKYVADGGDATLGNFIRSAGKARVWQETGKAAALGGLFGGLSPQFARLLPYLEKMPYMNKLLNIRPGKYIAKRALESGALTSSRMIVERELPSLEQVGADFAMVAGLDLSRRALGKFRDFAARPLIKPKDAPITLSAKEAAYNKMWRTKLKDYIPEWATKIGEGIGVLPEAPRKVLKRAIWEQRYQDYVSAKQGAASRIKTEWYNKRNRYEKIHGKKFTPKEMDDLIYYMERTGNPNVNPDESFKDVAARLPKAAKTLADKEIRPFFKRMLTAWNTHPETKDISPRKAIEDFYLPHLYENATPEKIAQLRQKIKTRYRITHPHAKMRDVLTYRDAALEVGLKPRFKDPIELAQYYGRMTSNLIHQAEYKHKITDFQKKTGDPIILLKEQSPKAYENAKRQGFVAFEDPFLRQYKKDGKWKTSPDDALVNPDAVDALKGVFMRDAVKPTYGNRFLSDMDNLKHNINYARTFWSFFHNVPIAESAVGARGFKSLSPYHGIEGRKLRANARFINKARERGLQVSGPKELEYARKNSNIMFRRFFDALQHNDPTGVLKNVRKATEWGFKEFIPNQKILAYEDLVKTQKAKFEQKYDRKIKPDELKALETKIAEMTNNIFGGQNWERSKYFRDPNNLKWLRRTFAFGDWTTSAVKQVLGAFKPGIEGQIGRKYIGMFMLRNGLFAGFARALLGGLTQTDTKNYSVSGLKFDPEKAIKAFENVRLGKGVYTGLLDWFSWVYPDVKVDLGFGPVNLGRDKDGTRMVGHLGKQVLENVRWLKDPVGNMMSKANPIISQALKQTIGGVPRSGDIWAAKAGYYRGRYLPWEGKSIWSKEGLKLRAISMAEEFVPFSFRAGAKRYILSALGSIPMGKRYTPYRAEDDFAKAIKDPNPKSRKSKEYAIKAMLRDNNYSEKDIKSAYSKVHGQFIRDKYNDRVKDVLLIKDDAKRKKARATLSKEMKNDPLNITKKQIDYRFKSIQESLEKAGDLPKPDVVFREYESKIRAALRQGDTESLNNIRKNIKDTGVRLNDRQIKNRISKIKKSSQKIGIKEKINPSKSSSFYTAFMDEISSIGTLQAGAKKYSLGEVVKLRPKGVSIKAAKDLYKEKIAVIMREFKDGKLRSSRGKIVKSRRQALAIALSEARKAVKYGSIYKSDWTK